jgi:ferredoxin
MEGKKEGLFMIPVVNLRQCSDCGSCLEICPEVFERNPETGFLTVLELNKYPKDCVQAAINICPVNCIEWEDF